MTRLFRTQLQVSAAFGLMALTLLPAQAQDTDEPITLGIAAPLSDSVGILGRQLAAGARAAAEKLGDDLSVAVVEADTKCSADGGKQAAESFVAMNVSIVVGFLCADAIEAALPILAEAAIPTLDVGVRANRLTDRRERTGFLIWRVAPRSDEEAAAAANYLARRWKAEPFGLLEDGSIAARALSDSVRRLLAEQGMKPQTIDNYRPAEEKQFGLVRRLERTGVTRFFIAGDRPDIAIIARDAAEIGLALDIVGGEALFDEANVDVPLPDGVVAVAPRTHFPELQVGSPDEGPMAGPQGYFGPAFAATQIAVAAAGQSRKTDRPIPDILGSETFPTALGAVRFNAKGDSDLDLYRVFEWRDNGFVGETGG
ncbi:MAG TPA: ABC transporter substrate-binding protein [Aurantimonas sp.]